MSEMLERIARAIEPKCRAFGQGEMPMLVAREFARAAVEALRSEIVLRDKAGNVIHEIRGAPSDVLSAMIDAILEERA